MSNKMFADIVAHLQPWDKFHFVDQCIGKDTKVEYLAYRNYYLLYSRKCKYNDDNFLLFCVEQNPETGKNRLYIFRIPGGSQVFIELDHDKEGFRENVQDLSLRAHKIDICTAGGFLEVLDDWISEVIEPALQQTIEEELLMLDFEDEEDKNKEKEEE